RERGARRHGAAVRSNSDLRARTRGSLRRQYPPRRFDGRLALQHLSLCRIAAGADRLARPRVARRGRPSRGRRLPLFRQPQRRVARVREDARGALTQRAALSGGLLEGGTGGGGRERRERRGGGEGGETEVFPAGPPR